MSDRPRIDLVDCACPEEGRTAHLMVEREGDGEAQRVVGIQCDNPKFHALKPWECDWSCWDHVAGPEEE